MLLDELRRLWPGLSWQLTDNNICYARIGNFRLIVHDFDYFHKGIKASCQVLDLELSSVFYLIEEYQPNLEQAVARLKMQLMLYREALDTMLKP